MKYVGALRCSRAALPFMKTAGWGRIINISGGNARNAGNRPYTVQRSDTKDLCTTKLWWRYDAP